MKMLDFNKGEHRQPPYTIPMAVAQGLIDYGNSDFTIREFCAINCYLTERYDAKHSISFLHGSKEYAEM